MYSRQPAFIMTDRSIYRYSFGVLMVFMIVASGSHAYKAKVTTRFGQVQGLLSRSTRGRLVAHYLGIPFAQPPVDDLRFRSPRPWIRNWTETFLATEYAPVCVQVTEQGHFIGEEDCLYLNVYVPLISEENGDGYEEKRALPVMVYVHGGMYATNGGNNRQVPPEYMMDQDVIVVSIQYRLNILGFFATATKRNPGNNGLKDIVMALRWVQENIRCFNGDPNIVTLWGHSAGASAVHLLAITNKTEGLFNRYIVQSGVATSPTALLPAHWIRIYSLVSATLVGCLAQSEEEYTTTAQPNVTREQEWYDEAELSEEEEEEMMRCLRKLDVGSFRNTMDYHIVRWSGHCCIFAPTIEEESDDAIVTVHPLTAIKQRLFRDIPAIVGVTKDEGLMKSIAILTNPSAEDEILNNFEMYLLYLLEYRAMSNDTLDALTNFYFDGNVTLSTLRRNITEIVGDALIVWPTYETLKYQSNVMNSSTYLYVFSYEGTFSATFAFTEGVPRHFVLGVCDIGILEPCDIGSLDFWNFGILGFPNFGVSHVDDLNYLLPIFNKEFEDYMLHNTEDDITMINIMTEMWASFATKGVPEAWRVTPWPDYKESQKFLQIGVGKLPEITIESEFFPERMAFWEELSANLTYDPADDLYFHLKQRIEDDEDVASSGASLRYDETMISSPTFHLLFTYFLSILERNC
ncbi:esterase FE4-like isoform X1 [Bombus impatiens]|uniref:Esterase FE4-like isoform X1 n=1 Tax=Bombus impatiens TaxID=132113 RepID=A0A6P3UZH1_BOMIM|nr:esterase FE4-like isoform X1 [Bombus impatiens]